MNLRAEHVNFSYQPGNPVLREITLDIRPGCVTGLFGPNGSGKSTLLRCLNGALTPQSGSILLDGQSIDQFSPRELARKIAVVSQSLPENIPFTALQMVLLGRFAHWEFGGHETPEDRRIVRESLARVDAESLGDRPFEHLSGGERQRVILARALAQQAPVLLLDEPAAHLDITHQLELYRLARTLAAEGYTLLMVCHDLVIAPMFVDHAVLLKAGAVLASGPPRQAFHPTNLAEGFGCAIEIEWPPPNSACLKIRP
jgi:iron complex transport system ATP-binding protein